jgi:hypothetical protein
MGGRVKSNQTRKLSLGAMMAVLDHALESTIEKNTRADPLSAFSTHASALLHDQELDAVVEIDGQSFNKLHKNIGIAEVKSLEARTYLYK